VEGDDGTAETKLIDIMNPPGVFNNGIRQKDWNIKDLPPFSARLMPEFYQRRSIKDMFKKPTAPAIPASTSNSQAVTSSTSHPTSVFVGSVSSATPQSKTAVSPSPDRKRKASETSVSQPKKKQKAALNPTSKAAPAKGQKSLKGFFQSKPKPEEPTTSVNESTSDLSKSGVSKDAEETVGDFTMSEAAFLSPAPHSAGAKDTTSPANARGSPMGSETTPNAQSLPPLNNDDDEMVYDPIENKESWQTLFRKPAAPLCESHEEPCKSMQTRKKGENQGRSFWMCSRPLGPTGTKEKGTQWRCPTFIWCSDFKAGYTRQMY
jgi:AP endonuclease-2